MVEHEAVDQATRKPSAPAVEAASTSPAVEGPPAIGATTTGHRASRCSTSGMPQGMSRKVHAVASGCHEGGMGAAEARRKPAAAPSDPAAEPHPRQPGGVRKGLAGQHGIQVVEI